MQSIAIVEALSSGQMYIRDIIERGYNPIYITTKALSDDPFFAEYRMMCVRNFGAKVEFLEETEDLDVLVAQLRERNTVLCLPGTEGGVKLADRICTAMGLPGNDAATTYLRATKAGMVEALARAGIRHIQTETVGDVSDIARFWRENDLDRCVLKFSESAGTVGVKVCGSIEEAESHYRHMMTIPNGLGTDDHTVLIQEYIGGTEYIVNTLSCNGEHMLTDVWVYGKILQEDGTLAYDYGMLVKDLEPGNTEMIAYAYKVLDAVQMRWGPCHIEIKVDRKGPVLIETNARPMGLAMTATYLDECLGYHITALTLDTMIHPQQFKALSLRPYAPRKYALMKIMIIPERIVADFSPTMVFANALKSMREVLFFGKDGVSEYARTVDLDTSPLTLKMINEDYGELRRDYELLRLIEKNYFDIYYTSLDDTLEGCERVIDRESLVSHLDPMRRYLLVEDDGNHLVQFGESRPVGEWGFVDGVIYGRCASEKTVDRIRDVIRCMSLVRSGGHFMFLPESYGAFKNGVVTAEFLLRANGFDLNAPTYYNAGILAGYRR
ncbi:MAG: ATP-grasp domain-containing protein [archaeon]|nr:ATP-grasp domain-containing protein [archaeon]